MRRFLFLPWVLLGMMVSARAQEPGPHPRLLVADQTREQDAGYRSGAEYGLEELKLPSAPRLSPGRRTA